MKRPWIALVLMLLVTLSAGFGLGIFYSRHHVQVRVLPAINLAHLTHRMQHQLDLDSAQSAAVATILARRQVAIDSLWGTLRPQVRQALDTTLIELISVLRDDQKVKLRGMIAEMHPGVLHHLTPNSAQRGEGPRHD
jgi:hypothetical protein